MRARINEDIKTAMKSGDKRRLSTLRLINAAIKDRDIAARVDEKGKATGVEKVSDSDILALLQKMIKQRKESIETYKAGNREDLVDQEASEITVIEEYLPSQMSDAELQAAVAKVIADIGAAGLKDMGRTMAALKERHTGSMDFGKASALVKEQLK